MASNRVMCILELFVLSVCIIVLLFLFFLFLPTTGHAIMAIELVGSGSRVVDFPTV